MTVEELSAKAIRSTNYAAVTTVSIQETIHDIGKIVAQNSGTIEACKETSYGSLIHSKQIKRTAICADALSDDAIDISGFTTVARTSA